MNRRQFLAASALIAGRTFDRESQAADDRRRSAMSLGFSTYGTKSLTTEAALDLIAGTGFDAVELTVWPGWDAEPAQMPADRRDSVRHQIERLKLRLTSLMEHIVPADSDAEHAASLKRLAGVFELARDLAPDRKELPVVQTVLGGGDWEKKKSLFRDRVGDWVELGKSHRVVLCVKPHRGGGMSQPSEAIWLIEQLGNTPWCRMVYDYSHYAFRDIPLIESVKQSLPYTAHVAVKDAIQESNGRVRFDLPGAAGTIDFPEILKALHSGGYRGDVSCEVSGMVWNRPGYVPSKAVTDCYRNVLTAFQTASVPHSR
jgi:sugar phosphate isomerase/epimerase